MPSPLAHWLHVLKEPATVLLLSVGFVCLLWAAFGEGDELSTIVSQDTVGSLLGAYQTPGDREIHSLGDLTETERTEAWLMFCTQCKRAAAVEQFRIYSRAFARLVGSICLLVAGLRILRRRRGAMRMSLSEFAVSVRTPAAAPRHESRVA